MLHPPAGPCTGQLPEYLLSSFPRRTVSQGSREQLSGIRKTIAYMDLHFRERITLEQLSAMSGYNPSYFSELFRRVTGQSYTERLAVLKTRHAKALLAQGFSVTEACFRSGFGSANNFLYTFKKLEGVSPSEYKKRLSHQP
jgi:two-component system response regulator YesN